VRRKGNQKEEEAKVGGRFETFHLISIQPPCGSWRGGCLAPSKLELFMAGGNALNSTLETGIIANQTNLMDLFAAAASFQTRQQSVYRGGQGEMSQCRTW